MSPRWLLKTFLFQQSLCSDLLCFYTSAAYLGAGGIKQLGCPGVHLPVLSVHLSVHESVVNLDISTPVNSENLTNNP